ncbi:MAG: hypothetical protein ACRETY_00990 [Steroidobacteraceae bacterium]
MRATLGTILMASGLALAAATAVGEDEKDNTQAQEQAQEQQAAKAPAKQTAAAQPELEKKFTPPDGWHPKKRGQYTVYCRKDYNVRGTRVPAESCYDEAGIRAMIEAQREDQMMVDKMRRVCGGDASCGAH